MLSSGGGVDREREICMELENVRHNLTEIERRMRDARGNLALWTLLKDRHNIYLRREVALENELEIKYNFYYRRYL
ncbi:unnamed protein product [Withania somnifera]